MRPYKPNPQIPAETYQAARKGYNLRHAYLRIGDHLGDLLSTIDFTLLDSSASLGQDTIFRLALVTAFQYSESLADPNASEATLKRMDWKYALYLPAQHPGISADALCEFRHRLYTSPKGIQEFGRLLQELSVYGLYPGLTNRAPDSIEALYKVCKITRIDRLNDAMKAALSALVSIDPNWLRSHALPHWYERYKSGKKLQPHSDSQGLFLEEADILGTDISRLLDLLKQKNATGLANQPEIRRLALLVEEQYTQDNEKTAWRSGCANCACNQWQAVIQ